MARVKSILLYVPNSSLQCEHFFLPLTLKSRSLEELPLDDFPSDDGGFLGGTWGPGNPRIFEVAGGPGGISLFYWKKKIHKFQIIK